MPFTSGFEDAGRSSGNHYGQLPKLDLLLGLQPLDVFDTQLIDGMAAGRLGADVANPDEDYDETEVFLAELTTSIDQVYGPFRSGQIAVAGYHLGQLIADNAVGYSTALKADALIGLNPEYVKLDPWLAYIADLAEFLEQSSTVRRTVYRYRRLVDPECPHQSVFALGATLFSVQRVRDWHDEVTRLKARADSAR